MSQTAYIVSNLVDIKTGRPRVRRYRGPTSRAITHWLTRIKSRPQYEHVIVRTVDEADIVHMSMDDVTHRPSWLVAAEVRGKAARMAGAAYNVHNVEK